MTEGGGAHSEQAGAPVHVTDGLEPEAEHTVQVLYMQEGEILPGSGSSELTFTTLSPGVDPVTLTNPIADVSAAVTSITEGEAAEFTLTVNPPPTEPLLVEVDVGYGGTTSAASLGVAGQLGWRTVVVPVSGSAQNSTATTDNDGTDNDGFLSVEIVVAASYQKQQFGGVAQMVVLNDALLLLVGGRCGDAESRRDPFQVAAGGSR